MKTFPISADELLQLWKLHHGYGPMRNDCIVSRTDGPDLDSLIMEKIRSWYVKSLTDMPLNLLPLTDVTDMLELTPLDGNAAWSPLPANCLRVASATSAEWTLPALIVRDLTGPEALAQTNPFARAGAERPVAITGPDCITFFPAPSPESNFCVKAVMLPEENAAFYDFTAPLLAQIPFID